MMPNFLIIGAAKAGTSSLYQYLKQHPQIFLPVRKETNFFAFEGKQLRFNGPADDIFINHRSVTCIEGYKKLYTKAASFVGIGEVCPLYLYSSDAPLNIRKHIPKAKIIVVLRNPIDRAFSAFCHMIRDLRENSVRFEDAINLESQRIENNWEHIWHYTRMGFYFEQLSRYYSVFPKHNIKVYLYDDLLSHPAVVINDLFNFLGVDNEFVPDMSIRYNVGSERANLKSFFLHLLRPEIYRLCATGGEVEDVLITARNIWSVCRFLAPRTLPIISNKFFGRLLKVQQNLSKENRDCLIRIYKSDILLLSKLINRDLSSWMV